MQTPNAATSLAFTSIAIEHLPEVHLQKLLRTVLNDSARVWEDARGRRLQVISTGEWNHNAGPDFKHVALLAEGRLYVGDGEFHRNSSDWRAHNHSADAAYSNVVLHIVLHNDTRDEFARYTLAVPATELLAAFVREQRAFALLAGSSSEETAVAQGQIAPEQSAQEQPSQESIVAALEVLQEYALRRLNARTAEAHEALHAHKTTAERFDTARTLAALTRNFLTRQQTRSRRRPNADLAAQSITERDIERSAMAELVRVVADVSASISTTTLHATLSGLLKETIAGEGNATRLELMTNVVLPLLLALANMNEHREQRTALLAWFWSLPAKNRYGTLKRRFPHIPQRFVWQQQGMLAYLAELKPTQIQPTEIPPTPERHENIASTKAVEVEYAGHDSIAGVELWLYAGRAV